MFENSDFGYGKYILEEFEFDYGQVLKDVQVEYSTSGTPEYDSDGNIINAVIFCHSFNGNYSSINDLSELIGPESALSYLNFFLISITSLGYPESCSPSTTNLKYNFPKYSIKNRVDFRRKFLAEKFNITKVLGIIGLGAGGYEAYTWSCEYPDEMEFLIIGGSSFKTTGYRYVASRVMDAMIDSSDAYYDEYYSESLSRVMVSINRLIYSQYFSKKMFQNFTLEEIDALMDDFVDEGLFVDIYDFKYRNDAVLDYNLEDKLSNITAKTLIISHSDDIYFNPEFDVYPIKDKIENLKIHIFDAQEFVLNEDYTIFIDLFREFLDEFKK